MWFALIENYILLILPTIVSSRWLIFLMCLQQLLVISLKLLMEKNYCLIIIVYGAIFLRIHYLLFILSITPPPLHRNTKHHRHLTPPHLYQERPITPQNTPPQSARARPKVGDAQRERPQILLPSHVGDFNRFLNKSHLAVSWFVYKCWLVNALSEINQWKFCKIWIVEYFVEWDIIWCNINMVQVQNQVSIDRSVKYAKRKHLTVLMVYLSISNVLFVIFLAVVFAMFFHVCFSFALH